MEYVRYKPNGLWLLDETSIFKDYSGYGNNITFSGTLSSKGISLSRYAQYSQLVNSTKYITFPQSVYIAGRERQDFSLVASVFLPDTGTTGNQQILSNNGRSDGLYINGNIVNFATAYSSTGTATCSYQIPENKKVDVIGVHTLTKNYLYVDGMLVDSIDITSDQQADNYATTDGNLYAGKLSTQNLLINTVAIYPRALRNDEILSIYAGNNFVSATEPIYPYGGEKIDVTAGSRPPYLNAKWDTSEAWNSATLQAVFVDSDNYLKPEMLDDNTSMAGVWTDTVNIYNGDVPTAINAVYLWWDGLNVSVDTSIDDGTTWVAATRGTNLTNITTGFDPTGKVLQIRATFTAGVTEAYIGNLQAVGYLTNTAQQPSGRIITYTNPVTTLPDQQPMQLREDWGAKMLGGTLTIGTDTTSDTPMTVQTVEVWIKQLGSSAPTYSTNIGTLPSIYTNGIAGMNLRRGEWNVLHFTSPTNIAGNLTFTGNVQVGRVVIYGPMLSSTDISTIVTNYTGRYLPTRAHDGVVNVIEPANSANIYAHDWANV